MKFKVKKNPIHVFIFILVTIILCTQISLQSDDHIYFSCIMLLNLFNFFSLYRSTYEITNHSLVVKYFFTNTEIPFENIRHIKYYGKQLDSEKWTRQRLEIMYELFDTLTVCVPKEEEKFISLLKDKCPNLKVIDKPTN
ncbi:MULTISPECIES: PH domain-containing protein [Bacillus]|uniref:Uncharacterized protein YyaB-like PH domain-containing protein n=1 Tax=Bacillus pseudomycoides TaxID=64104 RepID=A0AAJ1Z916_9BACI|nr:PH domain-containing protein [Bacillus pseudomycoides]KFN14727.1 bacterial PH domain protein [Bacillus pseudomycoides]MCR8859002.1 PH domain-containing protein [Bacillus pseudomycoides]MDR4185905.1 hypothetical protein [Bacillus pseudomycoides]MDR4329692.1 hypothetical protein [Bacillus pseudomycoides]MED0857403.1 PH domain-containing protein [Bacillus pseudomycoides]